MIKNIIEIENEIKALYGEICEGVEDEFQTMGIDDIYFQESTPNGRPGAYVFPDEKGYHLDSVGERGGIIEQRLFNNFSDICFELCWSLCSSISIKYASKNRIKGEDWRRVIFPKSIQLLGKISLEFAERGQAEIDKILEENPYDDELLGNF